jgi:hypothetical protein
VVLLMMRKYEEADDADSSNSNSSSAVCEFDYDSILINNASELAGLFFALLTIDRLGRRPTQWYFYLLGAVALAVIGSVDTKDLSSVSLMTLGLLARFSAMGASCATWTITPELFKTDVRVTAHALMNTVARLGAFAAPYVVDSTASVGLISIILAGFNIIAAGASFQLPETLGRAIDFEDDNEDDADDNKRPVSNARYDAGVASPLINKE